MFFSVRSNCGTFIEFCSTLFLKPWDAFFGSKPPLQYSSRRIFLTRSDGFTLRRAMLFLILLALSGSAEAAVSFSAGTSYQDNGHVGQFPYAAISGDFNADTHPDLAVVYNTGSYVSIFTNYSIAPGTFNTAGSDNYGVWNANYNTPYSGVTADFDGDGKLDLAITEQTGTGSYRIVVLRGNGDGTFNAAQPFVVGGTPSGSGPTGIASGDFNGDGKPDLAITLQNAGKVSVLINNGSSGTVSFLSSVEYTTAAFPSSIGVADLNKDGKKDLIVQCAPGSTGSGLVSIFRGNGDGTFQAKEDYPAGTQIGTSLAIGDFNGDGYLDIATVDGVGAATVRVALHTGNTGSGQMYPTTQGNLPSYATGNAPYGVVAADIDGDGKLDLAVANNSSSSFSVLINNGFGVFLAKSDTSTPTNPYGITAADFDKDGKIDIVTVARGGGAMWDPTTIHLNTSTAGVPSAPTGVSASAGNTEATVSFTPSFPNGSAVTNFTVTSTPGGLSANGSSSPITVNGLTNGVAYTFKVTATNGNGTSALSSASGSVTPNTTVPGAPTGVSGAAGNGQITVSFTAPANNGGSAIDSYNVICTDGNVNPANSGAASPITVTGLANGTGYTCSVTAHNTNGTGTASSSTASITPAAQQPSATTGAVSGVTTSGATFSGTVSSNGASTTVLFQYDLSNDFTNNWTVTASQSPLAANASGSAVSATASGLSCNTTYLVRVKATNSAGTTNPAYVTFTTSTCPSSGNANTASNNSGWNPPPPPPPTPVDTAGGASTPLTTTTQVVANPDRNISVNEKSGAATISSSPDAPYVISPAAPNNALIVLPPVQPVGITTGATTLFYTDLSGDAQLLVKNVDGSPKLEVVKGVVQIVSKEAGNTIPIVSADNKLVGVVVTTTPSDNITVVRKDEDAKVFVNNGKVDYQGKQGGDAPVPVYQGENAQLDKDGNLSQVALGSAFGLKGLPGDPLPPTTWKKTETKVIKLDGKLARFANKLSLLDILRDALAQVSGRPDGELFYDKDSGIVTYLVGNVGYRLIAMGEVLVQLNQLSAANVAANANGAFSLASQGIQITLAGTVGYFGDLQKAIRGIDPNGTISLMPSGILDLRIDGKRYAALPGITAVLPDNPTPVPGFENRGGVAIFRDHLGAEQALYPAFADADKLLEIIRKADPAASLGGDGNGAYTLRMEGRTYTVIPDFGLRELRGGHIADAWWKEGDIFYLHNSDHTMQGFQVR